MITEKNLKPLHILERNRLFRKFLKTEKGLYFKYCRACRINRSKPFWNLEYNANLPACLSGAFIFGNTKEGFDFWDNIRTKLVEYQYAMQQS